MSVWPRVIEEIERFPIEVRELPVFRQVTPADVRTDLENRYTFETPVPLESLTADVIRLLRAQTVHVTHPRYFGLFNPSVRPVTVVADALVALYNPQLAAWSHAPAANEIERLTLRSFMRALGWNPDQGFANFTTGGAEANLSAVVAALAHTCPEWATSGVAGSARPMIYLTSESHHSFVKIARMTGLGTDALHEVPVTQRFTLDAAALTPLIQADLQNGRRPLMVVGTAGTTGAGLIDPLPELAETARRFGVWFHVDAAWGGSAALSSRLRSSIRGVEQADSVTWDAHKWLSVPMGAGMFFCRHPEMVKRAFAISPSYMPEDSGGQAVDPYMATAQWSRRLIGLKVFMALAELGVDGYGAMIERQAALGDFCRDRLRDAGWIIRNHTPLPVVCFSHPDIRSGRVTTGQILETVYSRGRVWISDVLLGGHERVLRACVTSYQSTEADIDCLIEELEHARSVKALA